MTLRNGINKSRLPVLLKLRNCFKENWRSMTGIEKYLSRISTTLPTPVEMFQAVIGELKPNPIVMNLATVDKEFGVLNRSVIYRGLSGDSPPHICFVTERNSRKYQNLQENRKISVTILCSTPEQVWQIRLFNAEAYELSGEILDKFWLEELPFSKIRSHIRKRDKPTDLQEIEKKCQEIVKKYESESKQLERTESYTAFKIVPKLWEFYKSEPQKIADRVQYKIIEGEKDKWEIYHVNA